MFGPPAAMQAPCKSYHITVDLTETIDMKMEEMNVLLALMPLHKDKKPV